MRWSKRKRKAGERRQEDVFLFLPLTIKGETRWLEDALVEYEWTPGIAGPGGYRRAHWRPIAWAD
jgi:hypothetical protein